MLFRSAYILIYFMRGSLPWQGRQGDRRDSFVQKMKQNMPVDVICEGLPEEFKRLLKYARALKFSQQKKGENNTLFSLHARPLESNTMPLESNAMPLEFNARALEYFCHIAMVTKLNAMFSPFC